MQISDRTRDRDGRDTGGRDRGGAAARSARLKTCVISWLVLSAGGWLVLGTAAYALAKALS